MIKYIPLLLLLLGVISSCVTTPVARPEIGDFQEMSITYIQTQWGQPAQYQKFKGGREVFVFRKVPRTQENPRTEVVQSSTCSIKFTCVNQIIEAWQYFNCVPNK